MKPNNFFIFDSEGRIVGNPKGYATHKGASIQANSTRTPAGRALWCVIPKNSGRVYAIATMDVAIARGYTKATTN